MRDDHFRRVLKQAVVGVVKRLAAGRLNAKGVLIIDSRAHRSQAQNRAEARARLVDLVRRASRTPRRRRQSRPGAHVQERRLAAKKRRGAVKAGRTAARRGADE